MAIKLSAEIPIMKDVDEEIQVNTTEIEIAQGKINTLISKTGIQELEEGTTLYDKYVATRQSIDGIATIVGEHSSTLREVDSKVENVQTAFNQTKDQFSWELDRKISELDGQITEKYSNDIVATVENFMIALSQVQGLIESGNENLSTLNQYFDFTVNGLEIGKVGNPFKVHIDNDSVDFKNGEKILATMTGDITQMPKVEIADYLNIGNHKIEKYNDEITLIRYIG